MGYCSDRDTVWKVRGSNPRRGNRFFRSPKRPYWLCGPPNVLFNVYRGSSPEVKRPGHEIDRSPPSVAEVNKEYCLEVMKCLRKAVRRNRPESWKEKKRDVPSLQSSLTLVASYSWLSHKAWDALVPQSPFSADLTPADFFLFQKLNSHWKIDILGLLRTAKKIRWQSCVLFHKRPSSNASKTGGRGWGP